jgi:amino-acid N-acetyltransferase
VDTELGYRAAVTLRLLTGGWLSSRRLVGVRTAVKITVRRARVADVRKIKELVDVYAGAVLLAKQLVTLYEDVQEFWVAERDGAVVGCGALHVLWEDLAEIRTLAVYPDAVGQGVGHALVERLIEQGRALGLRRLFVLTFEEHFFARYGFRTIEQTPVTAEVYDEMRRSHDEGVAEFLDLPYVKPNTLGNARMLLEL